MCFVRYQFFAGCNHHDLVLQQCCENATIHTLDDLQVLVDDRQDVRSEWRTIEFLIRNGIISDQGTLPTSTESSISSLDLEDRRRDGQSPTKTETVVGNNHSKGSSSSWDPRTSDKDRNEAIRRTYDKWLNQRPPLVVKEFVSDGCWQVDCADLNPDDIEVYAEPYENEWIAMPDRTGAKPSIYVRKDDVSLLSQAKNNLDSQKISEGFQPSLRGGAKQESESTHEYGPAILGNALAPIVASEDTSRDAQSKKATWADVVEEERDENATPLQISHVEIEPSNSCGADKKEEEYDPAREVWRSRWRDARTETSSSWRNESSSPRNLSRYVPAPPIEADDLNKNHLVSHKWPSTVRASSTYIKAPSIETGLSSTSKGSSYRPPIISRAKSYIEPLPKDSASLKEFRPVTHKSPLTSKATTPLRQLSPSQTVTQEPLKEARSLGSEKTASAKASEPSLVPMDSEAPSEALSTVQGNKASSTAFYSDLNERQPTSQKGGTTTFRGDSEVDKPSKSTSNGVTRSSSGMIGSRDLAESLENGPPSILRTDSFSKQSLSPVCSGTTTEPSCKVSQPDIVRDQGQIWGKEREGATYNGPQSTGLATEGESAVSLSRPCPIPVPFVTKLSQHSEGSESTYQDVIAPDVDREAHDNDGRNTSRLSTPDKNARPRRRTRTLRKRGSISRDTNTLAVNVLRTGKQEPATKREGTGLDTESSSAFPTLGASLEQHNEPLSPSTPTQGRRRRMSSIITAATERRTNSQADTDPIKSRESSIALFESSDPFSRNSIPAKLSGSTVSPGDLKSSASISPSTGSSDLSMGSGRSQVDKPIGSGSLSVRSGIPAQSYSAIVKSFTPLREKTKTSHERKSPTAEDWPEIPPEEDWAKQRARLTQANLSDSHLKADLAGASAKNQQIRKIAPQQKEVPTASITGAPRGSRTSSDSTVPEIVTTQPSIVSKESRHVKVKPDTSQRVRIPPDNRLTVKEGLSNAPQPQSSRETQQDVPSQPLTQRNKELLAKQTWRATSEVPNSQEVEVSDHNTYNLGMTEKASKTELLSKIPEPTKLKRQPRPKTGLNPTTLNSLPETSRQPTQLSKAELYNREAPIPPLLTTSRERSWASVLRSRSPAVSQASSRCSSSTTGDYVTPPDTPQPSTTPENLNPETLDSSSDGYYSAQEDMEASSDHSKANASTSNPDKAMHNHVDTSSASKKPADDSPTPSQGQTPRASHADLVSSNSDKKENVRPELQESTGRRRTGPSATIELVEGSQRVRIVENVRSTRTANIESPLIVDGSGQQRSSRASASNVQASQQTVPRVQSPTETGPQWYQHVPALPRVPVPHTMESAQNQIRGTFAQGSNSQPVPNDVQYFRPPIDPSTGQYLLPSMPHQMQMGLYGPQGEVLPSVVYPVYPHFQPSFPIYNPAAPHQQFPQQATPHNLPQQAYAGQFQVPQLHPYAAVGHSQTMLVHQYSSPTRGRVPSNPQPPTLGQTMQAHHLAAPSHGLEQYRSYQGPTAETTNSTQRHVGDLMSLGGPSTRPQRNFNSLGPGQVLVNNPTAPYSMSENMQTSRSSEGLWVDTIGNFTYSQPEFPRAQYIGGAWRTYKPSQQEISEKNKRVQARYGSGLEIWHSGQQVRKIQMCQNPVIEYVGWVKDGLCPTCAPDQHH